MFPRIAQMLVSLVVASSILAACGTKPTNLAALAAPTTDVTLQPTQVAPAAGAAGEGGEGGEGGVEAALVTYADTTQHFAIGYPGSWTRDTTIVDGVQFNGGDDRMQLEFVTAASGTNAMAYATLDASKLATSFPGFKQLGLAASSEVQGAIVLGFEADGTSTVTGKAYAARGDRYYMPLADGRIAVLTVVGPANRYDREGVRDIALTFKTTK